MKLSKYNLVIDSDDKICLFNSVRGISSLKIVKGKEKEVFSDILVR